MSSVKQEPVYMETFAGCGKIFYLSVFSLPEEPFQGKQPSNSGSFFPLFLFKTIPSCSANKFSIMQQPRHGEETEKRRQEGRSRGGGGGEEGGGGGRA